MLISDIKHKIKILLRKTIFYERKSFLFSPNGITFKVEYTSLKAYYSKWYLWREKLSLFHP